MHELSIDEQNELLGGDWFERGFGFMVGMAFFAGALAMPGLLVASGMTLGFLVITSHLTMQPL